MTISLNKKDLLVLIDLEKRLVDNYNNGNEFQQHEEDRLIIGRIIDKTRGDKYGRNI